MLGAAVVTGGASGIGAACARRLAAEGRPVWVLDANGAGAEAVAAEIAAGGGAARAAAVDVTDDDGLAAVAARVAAETGAPGALVTAAGILEAVSTVLDEDMAVHDRVWAVNYRGVVATCRAFGRQMREAGAGAIVTVGSINSFSALPLPAYGPSKTAIWRLTQILAVELGRHGVRVNGVAPTYVVTPAMQAKIDAGERDPAVMRAAGALDMLVRPEHVAEVVAFLCSEAAAAVTGVMMPVDAGYDAAVSYKSFAGGVPWGA
jgi:NAD(P)-dependent dehydrogenase (short-subunit alcohol dehydrogenase family)